MHDQALVGALLEQVAEKPLDEPLSPGRGRRAHVDADERVRQLLDLLDPRPAHHRRRPLRKHRRDPGDELLGALAFGDEQLHPELLDAAREHAHRGDLRVVDVDRLTVEGAQLRPPERHVLDNSLDLEPWDGHGVADGVPALGEHRQPGDQVREDALDREAGEDQQERRAGDRGQSVEPADQLGHGQDKRRAKARIRDPGADQGNERLAPLDVDELAGRLRVADLAALVPDQHATRYPRARAREQPGADEDGDDHHDSVVDQSGHGTESSDRSAASEEP